MAVRNWMVVGSCIIIIKFGYRLNVCGRTSADIPVAF